MDRLRELLDVQALTTSAVAYAPRVLVAIVILVAFWGVYRATRPALTALFQRAGLHEKLTQLLVRSLYRFTLLVFALVMAASQLGINVGAALAGIGVVGLAVGFAAQDSLANTIAGLVIFWDKPFVVGDYVTVQDNYGEVTDITLRSTRIRTNRNTYVVIPNKQIIDVVLINHSKHGAVRVDVPVGIAYEEHIPAAREVLLRAVSGLDGVAVDPAPSVVADELAGSSVNLLVRVWIDEARDEQPVRFRTVEACKLALDAAGMQIPFPHLQVIVDDVQERVWRGAASVARASRASDT
jgi:small conductance mechanosensitive channel